MATAPTTSRYDTILKLASGGMATVWVGTVRGALGFRQLVAIKKPHPHLLNAAGFRAELIAEARLASMIHHANVVDVRDVEIEGDSISLVMDYIEGASLGELIVAANKAGKRMAPRVAVRIVLDALAGLHAAHELVDERDRFVGLVHRDISPQNILVGSDGIARVADFGVAKFARKNMQSTSDGSLKGKLAYMAPEYVKGETIDRRFDLFAMAIVLWEALAGKRCFRGDNEAETLNRLLTHDPEPISKLVPEVAALDEVLQCGLAKARDERFGNAAAMATALETAASAAGLLGGHSEVAAAVKEVAGKAIEERRVLVRAKLANEPSVASLMGVPLDAADQVAQAMEAPNTIAHAGPTLESPKKALETDEMPATNAVSTESGPYPTVAEAAKTQMPATAAPPTAIPATTLPMTPRMEGAPELPPEAAKARTMASPGVIAAAAPVPTTLPLTGTSGPPPPANATHLSAGVAAPHPVAPAPSPAPAPPLAAPATTTAATAFQVDDADAAAVPPPRRWVLPLVVGLVTAAVATIAIVAGAKQFGGPDTSTSSSSGTTSASVQSTSTAPSATVSAVSNAPAAVTAPAPSASAAPATSGKMIKGVKPPRGGAGATATSQPDPTPPTPGEPARKAPPPNPYQD